jgi:hypothetical protein
MHRGGDTLVLQAPPPLHGKPFVARPLSPHVMHQSLLLCGLQT